MFALNTAQALDFDPYVKLEASVLKVRIADVDFYPGMGRAALGVFLWRGVGFEAEGGFSNREDEDADSGIFANTDSYKSLALRLQSPFENEWAAYVTLGYAKFDLETYQKAPLFISFQEELKSGYASAGFEKQVHFYPRLSYALSYEHLFDDDLVEIKALSFSYRFAFGEQ